MSNMTEARPVCNTCGADSYGQPECHICGAKLPKSKLAVVPSGPRGLGMPLGLGLGAYHKKPLTSTVIVIEPNLKAMARRCIECVAAADLGVFRQSGKLVKRDGEQFPAWSFAQCRADLSDIITFEQHLAAGGAKRMSPPRDVVDTVLSLPADDLSAIRELKGVTGVPIIRSDGSLITGYDPDSKRYSTAPAIDIDARDLTREQAKIAADRLLRQAEGFRFADDRSKSVWLSLILTLAGRTLFDMGPMHHFGSANANGSTSGKSEAVNTAYKLVYGTEPIGSSPSDDAEMDKESPRFAKMPLVFFDNLPTGKPFGSAVLDRLLTKVDHGPRQFREQKTLPLSLDLTSWASGGNGITFGGVSELNTRVIVCELLTVRPGERRERLEFSKAAYWAANRIENLTDALTILCAYQRAGCPRPTQEPNYTRYTSWAHAVRDCLLWLDMADPVVPIERSDSDITNDAIRAIVARLGQIDGRSYTSEACTTRRFHAAELFMDEESIKRDLNNAEMRARDLERYTASLGDLESAKAAVEASRALLATVRNLNRVLGAVLGRPIKLPHDIGRALTKLAGSRAVGAETTVFLGTLPKSRKTEYWLEISKFSEAP